MAQAKANELNPEPVFTFFDFNGATGVEISTPELRDSADIAIKAHKAGSRGRVVAIIYARDDFPYALARMWQAFVDRIDWETKVFRDRSDAVAWVQEGALIKFGVKVMVQ